jgi:hypothetical protein
MAVVGGHDDGVRNAVFGAPEVPVAGAVPTDVVQVIAHLSFGSVFSMRRRSENCSTSSQ